MSLDDLLATRKLLLAQRESKNPQRLCTRCGQSAKWLTDWDGLICDLCERKQLAAEGRLPPGVRLED